LYLQRFSAFPFAFLPFFDVCKMRQNDAKCGIF
jgi:hypothetical protein